MGEKPADGASRSSGDELLGRWLLLAAGPALGNRRAPIDWGTYRGGGVGRAEPRADESAEPSVPSAGLNTCLMKGSSVALDWPLLAASLDV